ncbi:hypothetical protein GC387_30050 [Pseudomonas sp. MWU12-2323]|nr:hypothetical protein [Pseudomonas sp. MWU12-2323]
MSENDSSGVWFSLGICRKCRYPARHIWAASCFQQATLPTTRRKTTAWCPTTRFALDVHFEGERGLPKISQTRPREAGHKPAF